MADELNRPALARALHDALVPDPFYRSLSAAADGEPPGPLLAYLDYSMVEAAEFGVLHVGHGASGCSVWSRPLDALRQASKEQKKERFIRAQLGERAWQLYAQTVAGMHANSAPRVAEGAWYLSIVGVVPEYQNRGLGGALVSTVLAQTDALGVPTWLETFTPRNEPFYERLGYREAGRFREPALGASYALMVRDPR